MAIKDTFEDRRARGSSGNLAWSMPAGWCIVFDPTNARRGDWALHWEGSSDPAPAYLKEELSVEPGERVQAFGFAKRVTGSNAAGRIQVSWRDAAGAEISVSDGSSVTAGSYGQSRLLEEAPAGSVSARLLADVDGTSGNAHEIFFDDVLIQVVTQDSDVNWSGINDDGGKPEDNATANRIFRQTSAPSGTTGDIWHDTDDDLLYRHNGSAWQLIANGFDDTSQLTDGASLGDTAIWASISGSGKAEDNATRNQLFRQTSAPTASSTGDLWYDTDDELLYRWDGSSWVVYAPSGGESATTVTDSDSGTTSATATINRGGAQTQINVALSISGSAFSGGDPFPVAIQLTRGGPTGPILKQFFNIVGLFEEGFGGDPDFVICNFEGAFIDTDTGTGSTDYYVSGPNTAYNETLEITATQTYFS